MSINFCRLCSFVWKNRKRHVCQKNADMWDSCRAAMPQGDKKQKTKRVSFNPSTGLALSPSKRRLAPRKPTVCLNSTVKKNWTVIFKNITSGKPWTFFPHDATMINGFFCWDTTFLSVGKIVATKTSKEVHYIGWQGCWANAHVFLSGYV